jgi:hypothetical protein
LGVASKIDFRFPVLESAVDVSLMFSQQMCVCVWMRAPRSNQKMNDLCCPLCCKNYQSSRGLSAATLSDLSHAESAASAFVGSAERVNDARRDADDFEDRAGVEKFMQSSMARLARKRQREADDVMQREKERRREEDQANEASIQSNKKSHQVRELEASMEARFQQRVVRLNAKPWPCEPLRFTC